MSKQKIAQLRRHQRRVQQEESKKIGQETLSAPILISETLIEILAALEAISGALNRVQGEKTTPERQARYKTSGGN